MDKVHSLFITLFYFRSDRFVQLLILILILILILYFLIYTGFVAKLESRKSNCLLSNFFLLWLKLWIDSALQVIVIVLKYFTVIVIKNVIGYFKYLFWTGATHPEFRKFFSFSWFEWRMDGETSLFLLWVDSLKLVKREEKQLRQFILWSSCLRGERRETVARGERRGCV